MCATPHLPCPSQGHHLQPDLWPPHLQVHGYVPGHQASGHHHGNGGGGVCSKQAATTTIIFSQNFGSLPAARVRSLDLTFAGDPTAAHLYLVTQTVLTCPRCRRCTGGFFLGFQGVFTSRISATATPADLQAALREVYTLTDTGSVYGKIIVNVTSTGECHNHRCHPIHGQIRLVVSEGPIHTMPHHTASPLTFSPWFCGVRFMSARGIVCSQALQYVAPQAR